MTGHPDFSPAMLAAFLRAREADALYDFAGPAVRWHAEQKRLRNRFRKAAGLTHAEFEMARMGRLSSPDKRSRLWAVLGHFPADHGILLTQGGQEPCDG